ncbi:MAG TPA: hypothetical protein VFC19_52145 [Candidatus Limnocylindrales bacterium]|nr:hypothetical protein [Candidatus Limnocylindrales bacterium]
MDPTPSGSRALIYVTTAGVLLSAATTAATFTGLAAEFTFLRYPLLGAALVAVAMAGWSSGRLPAFNRTLWAHAPWWARLSWLTIIAASLGTFATISLTEAVPMASVAQRVLETRGIGAVAAYLFLIAGLRRNVDLSLAEAELADDGMDSTRKVVG